MFATIIFMIFFFLNAIAFGMLTYSGHTKPSLERSRGICRQSIFAALISLTLIVLEYLFETSIPEASEFPTLIGFSLGVSLVAIIVGLKHWRKYREFSRVSMEIDQGLSGETPEE